MAVSLSLLVDISPSATADARVIVEDDAFVLEPENRCPWAVQLTDNFSLGFDLHTRQVSGFDSWSVLEGARAGTFKPELPNDLSRVRLAAVDDKIPGEIVDLPASVPFFDEVRRVWWCGGGRSDILVRVAANLYLSISSRGALSGVAVDLTRRVEPQF